MQSPNSLLHKLNNIIDIFTPEPIFNKKDRQELNDVIIALLLDYITEYPLCFAEPNIDELLFEDIEEMLVLMLSNMYEFDIREDLEPIIQKAIKIFYTKYVPRRSYNTTFIRYNADKDKMQKKLTILSNKPQPEQRSPEWYTFRHSVLTASNAWKAFGSQATQNQLIYEKCLPINVEKYNNPVSTDSPLHWGQKYEPLSVMIYEKVYGTVVKDYGCILHDKYDFIAASPDGINDDINTPLFGRMLEIKNIVNREITGIPKFEYWIQMQLQMETCNLNECDFLETRFKEYEDEEEFQKDGSYIQTKSGEPKGMMLYFIKDGKPYYEYAPIGISKEEYTKWEAEMMMKNEENTWMKTIYWYLDEISCVLVLKNKQWFENAIIELGNIWNIILKERETGYEHRAPKKRINKADADITFNEVVAPKCYIDLDLNKIGEGNQQEKEMKNKQVIDESSPKVINIKTESTVLCKQKEQKHNN